MTRPAPSHPLLLVVDDDTQMRAMLRDLLTGAGFRVEEAVSSDELLDLAPWSEPAAIILDHDMPGPPGLELLPILRRCCPEVPVVFSTSFGGPRIREAALGLGAAAYLDKPFRIGDLLDAVRGVLECRYPQLSPPRQSAAPTPDDAACPLRGLTILLVEDNIAVRTSLSDLLRLDGARLLAAEDGYRALELLAAQQPDIVICDLWMPRMDGFEFIRRLRSDPEQARLFVVALTGSSGEEEYQRTRQAGFDAHLVKPVNYPALRRYVCIRGLWARRCSPRQRLEPPVGSGRATGRRHRR